jgi:hypothetical protein
MVFIAHGLETLQVRLMSVSNKEHISLEVDSFSSVSPLALQWGHLVLRAPALQPVKIRLKSVTNEGHFTLEVERVFRPYLPHDCI